MTRHAAVVVVGGGQACVPHPVLERHPPGYAWGDRAIDWLGGADPARRRHSRHVGEHRIPFSRTIEEHLVFRRRSACPSFLRPGRAARPIASERVQQLSRAKPS